jgi:hypothetical protein
MLRTGHCTALRFDTRDLARRREPRYRGPGVSPDRTHTGWLP